MIFILLQLLHAGILLRLESFIYPEFFVYPYLTLSGLVPYRQIIDQHFPGLFFLPVNFASLGFNTPVSFRTLLILMVLFQSALIAVIARRVSRSRLAAVFSVIAYTVWQPVFFGNHLWLESFISPLSLSAYFFWTGHNLFWSGLFLGLAVLFKQSLLLPLVCLTAYLLFRHRLVEAIRFFSGGLAPLFLISVYFSARGLFPDFFFWTVMFNLVYAVRSFSLPSLSIILQLVLPVVLVISSMILVKPRHRLMGLAVWGLLLIPGGLSRFDFTRIQAAVPFLSLLTGILLAYLISKRKWSALSLIALCLGFYIGLFYLRQANWGQYRFFNNETLILAEKIKTLSQPGDIIFLLGTQPHLYFLTRTLPPGNFFAYQLPWYLPLTTNRTLFTLADDPPRLVIYDRSAVVDGLSITEYAAPLIKYIEKYYQPQSRIGDTILYESRD